MSRWCWLIAQAAADSPSGATTRLWQHPLSWGTLFVAVGLALMLPRGSLRARAVGAVLGVVGLGLLAAGMPLKLSGVAESVVFWLLALITVGAAAAAVSMRSAVYAAIWFALSLVGTAGLFLFQGSQFLGVATLVVYAGAIVVTFLFVVMLAQPEGHATYDRISWGNLPKTFSAVAAATIVGVLTFVLSAPLSDQPRLEDQPRLLIGSLLSSVTDEQDEPLLRDDQLARVHVLLVPSPTLRITLRSNVTASTAERFAEKLAQRLLEEADSRRATAQEKRERAEQLRQQLEQMPSGSAPEPEPVSAAASEGIAAAGDREQLETELLRLETAALDLDDQAQFLTSSSQNLQVDLLASRQDVLHDDHMAHLGGELFSRHLISVELAGTLLLVALVGAVAIAIQGKQRQTRGDGP